MIIPRRLLSFDIAIPQGAHRLERFREWILSEVLPEEVTVHLVQGEIFIEMSPERIESHALVKIEIMSVVHQLARKLKLGTVYPDGTWITNDAAELSTEPDACFASWDTLKSGRLVAVERPSGDAIELRGSPDWVLEVVSPSSVKKDVKLHPISYFRAGVQEYWLIDTRREKIKFTVFVRGEEAMTPAPSVKGWHASPVFGKAFRLERRENPVGGWEFRLRVKSH
jgi:Uma2 family endonuclease